jgi:ketosteroid isomerase-like protein
MVWTVENGKAVVFQEYTDTEAFANTSIAAAS